MRLVVLGVAAAPILACTPSEAIRIELAPGIAHPDYDELVSFVRANDFVETKPEAYDTPLAQLPGSLRSSYMRSTRVAELRCAIDEVISPTPLEIICFEVHASRRPRSMSPEGTATVEGLVDALKKQFGQQVIR